MRLHSRRARGVREPCLSRRFARGPGTRRVSCRQLRSRLPPRYPCTLGGRARDGQLGHHDTEDISRPREVADLADVELEKVTCGAHHTIAVATAPEREVYAWGWGDFGRLGTGDPGDRHAPTPVRALRGVHVEHVACGDSHCLVVARDGTLFSFGRNQNGQLGLGDSEDRLSPCVVQFFRDAGTRVRRAAGGAEHSAVTDARGAMYTFGWGRYGNLGHGHARDLHVPTLVESLKGQHVTDPICGWRHSAALTDQGRLWTFGWSKYGQLGHGDCVDHWTPSCCPSSPAGRSPPRRAAGGTCARWRGPPARSTPGAGTTSVSWARARARTRTRRGGGRGGGGAPGGEGGGVRVAAHGRRGGGRRRGVHVGAVRERAARSRGHRAAGDAREGGGARFAAARHRAGGRRRRENAAKKRPRTEQDDMRVPSQKPHDADFAAVPDS